MMGVSKSETSFVSWIFWSLMEVNYEELRARSLAEKTPAWSGRSIWLRDGAAAKDGASY